jgi:hypothetical protein
MTRCKLTERELMVAVYVGARRHVDGLYRQSDRYAAGEHPDQWELDIEAAAAELAVARVTGLYWTGLNWLDAKADVGDDIQVRRIVGVSRKLLIRPHDPDEHVFVLVIGKAPTFDIAGWIQGRDGKRPEWSDNPGGRGPCFLVPRSELRPVGQMPAPRPLLTPPPTPPRPVCLTAAELFA